MQSDDKRLHRPMSRVNFLFDDVWRFQPPGWVHILADRGDRKKPLWIRSDDIRRVRKFLDKYDDWELRFSPHTYSEPKLSRRYALPTRWLCGPVKDPDDLGKSIWLPEPTLIWEHRDIFAAMWRMPDALEIDWAEYRCRNLGLRSITTLMLMPREKLDAMRLIRRYRVPVNKYMGAVTKGKRSDVMWKIAIECLQAGMLMDEVDVVIAASGAFKSRLEERGDRWAKQELKRLINKGLNYLHPDCRRAS